jgi:hypothetical protein
VTGPWVVADKPLELGKRLLSLARLGLHPSSAAGLRIDHEGCSGLKSLECAFCCWSPGQPPFMSTGKAEEAAAALFGLGELKTKKPGTPVSVVWG